MPRAKKAVPVPVVEEAPQATQVVTVDAAVPSSADELLKAQIAKSYEETGKYGIRMVNKDPAILQEMKDKLDKEKLMKIMSMGGTEGKFRFANRQIVNDIIDAWALAKYEFYLLFDRNLSISAPVKLTMNDGDFQLAVQRLQKKFPQYAPVLKFVNSSDFTHNKSTGMSWIKDYFDQYQSGMALTKLLHTLYDDKEFDDALSLAMTFNGKGGEVCVSIEPCDILMASYNKNNWSSCFSVNRGFQRSGVYQWMLDNSTMIAFMHDGNPYEYDQLNMKFTHTSKRWREQFMFDKDTCSVRGSYQYPAHGNNDGGNHEIAKELIKGRVDRILPQIVTWVYASQDRHAQTKCFNTYSYGECQGYGKTSMIELPKKPVEPEAPAADGEAVAPKKKGKDKITFDIDTKPVCVYCGKPMYGTGQFTCRECRIGGD